MIKKTTILVWFSAIPLWLIIYFARDNPEIIETIQSSGKLDEDTEKSLVQIIESYKK